MPYVLPSDAARGLIVQAQSKLGMQQAQLADLLGVSRRTVQRMITRKGSLHERHLHILARAVHARDAELAGALAFEGGKTLESLGLVPPAPPPAPPVAPPPPPRPLPPTRLLVESIVCAAAETMQSPPAAVRDVLRAAFARARGLGLSVEEVDDALSAPPEKREPARTPKTGK